MSALLVLKDVFTEHGFSFEQTTTGFEVPCRSASLAEEYQRLRQGIAFTELGDVLVYHVTGENASDYLDYIAAGDVIRLREEHILHTVCLNAEGMVIAEVYIANDEDDYFLFAEGMEAGAFDQFLKENLRDSAVQLTCLNGSHLLFSVDGPYSWMPIKTVFGPETLGLRYLGFFTQQRDEEKVYIFRSGKTGEYGYWILAPNETGRKCFEEVMKASAGIDRPSGLYGDRLTKLARLENHFLNLDAEGKYTRNPYELGLFWMIQNEKEMVARDVVEQLIERGMERSITGFVIGGEGRVSVGDAVMFRDRQVGVVVITDRSLTDNRDIGLALLDKDASYVGLTFHVGDDRIPINTVSLPFVNNESLTVKVE